MGVKVLETPTGWMIRCYVGTEGWHEYPKKAKPNATWHYNGDRENPTFTPSMNELLNPSNSPHFNPHAHVKDFRCHFTVTNGKIKYHGDCTHEYKNQTLDLQDWSDDKVKYYEAIMEEHRSKNENR